MKNIHTVKEDVYGNEISRTTEFLDFYEVKEFYYNEKNDLIEKRSLDRYGNIESKFTYEYEYDQQGNKINCRHTHFYLEKMQDSFVSYYLNEYDDDNRLISITYVNSSGKHFMKQNNSYDDDLLVKKEVINAPFTKVSKTHYFTYNKKTDIVEEEIRIEQDVISCYVSYERLDRNHYKKRLLSPTRKQLRWILERIEPIEENVMCTILIKEPSLTSDLLSEICEYIRANVSSLKMIAIDICESEDMTHMKEIEEVETYYKETYGIIVYRDM